MWQKIIKLSVYALVFLMPLFWLSKSFEVFEFNKGYLLFILVSLGILAWLGKMIFKDKKIRFRRTPLDLFVLGFLGVMILGALFSQDKTSSLLGFYGRFWPSLLGTFGLVGLYFLITNNVQSKKDESPKDAGVRPITVNGLLKTFLWSSFLVVLTTYFSLFGAWRGLSGLLAKISGKLALPQVMLTRSFNPAGGSLEALAIFLAFISVAVIGLLAFKKQGKSVGFYILLFSSLFLLALIDFWPAWAILVISLVLFLALSFWKRIFREDVSRLSLSILFIIVSLFFIFSNPLGSLLQDNATLGNLPSEVLLTQKASWGIGWQGIKENPVLGSGIGNFHYTFAQHKPQTFLEGFLWQLRFDRAGGHIAELFGTIGILGILSYSLLLGMFLIVSWMIISSKQQFLISDFQIPLLLAFLALLIGQFFYYQNTILAFSFWFILGLGVISWQRPVREKVFSFRDFPEVGLIFSVVFWVVLFGFLFSYFNLAKLYLADVNYRSFLANPEQNLEKLEKAAKLGDSRADYHIILARTYLRKLAQETAKAQPNNQVIANMVALAVQEGKRAEEVSPNRVASQETLGAVYRDIQGFAQGALGWGIKKFERAIELEPKNPVLLTELAKLQLTNNKVDKAKELFVRALELKPDYVDAVVQLAILEEGEGDAKKATSRLEELVNQAPLSVEAHFQLGRLYYNQKEYDKAILQFQTSLTLFPTHSNSLYSLGLIYERKGEKEKALQMFDKVLELNPANEDVRKKIEELKQ